MELLSLFVTLPSENKNFVGDYRSHLQKVTLLEVMLLRSTARANMFLHPTLFLGVFRQ